LWGGEVPRALLFGPRAVLWVFGVPLGHGAEVGAQGEAGRWVDFRFGSGSNPAIARFNFGSFSTGCVVGTICWRTTLLVSARVGISGGD
jgi:hypothetical protein